MWESNATNGLNFPIRQLSLLHNITIKHFPPETVETSAENFCCLYAFPAQHTTWLSRSCMFDYVLTIFRFFVIFGGNEISRITAAQCEKINDTQMHWRADNFAIFSCSRDYKIGSRFHLVQKLLRSLCHFSVFSSKKFHSFPSGNSLHIVPSTVHMRSCTTRSAAISANNGEPEKPQAGETQKILENPFQHALLSKLENSWGLSVDGGREITFRCYVSTR